MGIQLQGGTHLPLFITVTNMTIFTFHDNTPPKVREVLIRAYLTKQRVRLFYGDVISGRCWLEEHDVLGYIQRSTGPKHIPILVYNSRSTGGGAVLDHCIVRIQFGLKEEYSHPNFHIGRIFINTAADCELWEVLINGSLHSRHRTYDGAVKYTQFLTGERLTKR